MEINGKILAQSIISELEKQIAQLKTQGIIPKIAIITVGPEESWHSYVAQKLKVAKELGIETKLIQLKNSDQQQLIETIKSLNDDISIHGIIVQRPFPNHIDNDSIVQAISRVKDIDGFKKN